MHAFAVFVCSSGASTSANERPAECLVKMLDHLFYFTYQVGTLA